MKGQIMNGESSNPEAKKKQSGILPHNGMNFHHGVHIPSHMISPRAEGYRTPTGEDYQEYFAHVRKRDSTPNGHEIQNPPVSVIAPTLTEVLHPISRAIDDGLGSLAQILEERMPWKERLRHFTWTFFTITMATGGIANVLFNVPFRFPGIDTIGVIFFLSNIVLFVNNIICISLRFYFFPATFKASLLHPTESLFMPAAVVSFGTILINISQYGIPKVGSWLESVMLGLFWTDVALAIVSSCGIYLLMWSTQTFTISTMTPVWIFPMYPLLIIGPHAGLLSATMSKGQAIDIIVGGFTVQGIGYMVTLMIYSAFIYRLMTQKLPSESLRPGMFVSVGPSGFTASAIISMAANAERAFSPAFMGDGRLAAMIVRVIANWAALWLWGLALWFFFVAVGAHWSCIGHGRMKFAMTWFSFVFPNTALITATFGVGQAFGSSSIQVLGCVMTCFLLMVWVFVFFMMVRAIYLRQILWPQKGEDRDEGGFQGVYSKESWKKGWWPGDVSKTNTV